MFADSTPEEAGANMAASTGAWENRSCPPTEPFGGACGAASEPSRSIWRPAGPRPRRPNGGTYEGLWAQAPCTDDTHGELWRLKEGVAGVYVSSWLA
uniref:NADH dehydrogenase [ubiquinone] 1 alpha subcomplex assembly factor 8 isoform X1 n=1 Tax=Myodes glareolus TaxID=447135 RepID=UPI00202094F8|nr:NADH dehydrogenase [ubiquinone] 1 alpha subcomplex assembly factor 8 isoform X1 [Myodes glareolus]